MMRLFLILIVILSFAPFLSSAQDMMGEDQDQIFLKTGPLILPQIPSAAEQTDTVDNTSIGGTPTGEESMETAIGEKVTIRLNARLTQMSVPLKEGLVWRIFSPEPDFNNKLPLLMMKEGGNAEFLLEPGTYLIHVAFGLAEMTKQIDLAPGKVYHETMVLEAGGMALDATIADFDDNKKINKDRVRFTIHEADGTGADRVPIVQNVKAGKVVRLKAGVYHITSLYGSANAIASANIRVEAGKLTQAVLEHHAAQVTLKLVRTQGGEALADTSWEIMNASGDTVREIANAYVYLVLAEGDYIAYARNKEQNYQQEFTVIAGQDMEVDVLATNHQDPS